MPVIFESKFPRYTNTTRIKKTRKRKCSHHFTRRKQFIFW
jgi:hypothetical protein